MEKYVYGSLTPKVVTYVKKNESYSDNIITFDIETSSGYMIDGKLQSFDYSKDKEFYEDVEKFSLCYIWQASIDGQTYYGRELKDFLIFLTELSDKLLSKFIVWVHNLSFEFQFLLNIIKFDKVFARQPHKIIYAEYRNIQFRCSYFLTRLSLDTWAKEKRLPVKKLVGNLDYNIIRTPRTELTDNELEYCENDCLILHYGIKEFLEKYNHLSDIPLTQTGEVRRGLKNALHGNARHFEVCTNLIPEDASEYALLKSAFAGGYTHANYINAGEIVENIESRDIASSYPTVICSEKFPMSEWQYTSDWKEYRDSEHSLILDITFIGLKSVLYNDYISASHCYELEDDVRDNGKIIKANKCSLITTNVDFDIIEWAYSWDRMIVNNAYQSVNKYLSKEFIDYTLDSYVNKTKLKGVDDKQALYFASKQQINSLYGVMVTAIVQSDVVFQNDIWSELEPSIEAINSKLKELKDKKWKNFTAYQWGVWVTAYARRNLWSVIKEIDRDVVYCDTDSVKFIGSHAEIFDEYNKSIDLKLKVMCENTCIDYDKTRPIDVNGNAHPLGEFEFDGKYKRFITLGSKRYAYEDSNGDLHITVSGVNKKTGVAALKGNLENFNDGLVFNYKESGKFVVEYRHDMGEVVWNRGFVDEYKSDAMYGITLTPTTYSMDLTETYLDLLTTADLFKENFKGYDAQDLHRLAVDNAEGR